MAKEKLAAPTADIAATVAEIHKQHAVEAPKEPPLTGVEVAKEIAAIQPPSPPLRTQYRLREASKPDSAAVVVVSPDGSVEDAVREFNKGRKEVRTAKQLIIEKLASVA